MSGAFAATASGLLDTMPQSEAKIVSSVIAQHADAMFGFYR
jgi:hypothetical protein